ncbi:MAG: V-type ATP synthase subunit K [Candidatus Thermoplasmatota archaeon]|nr:V-type ATP synthase subunit K [Candidatus Thermoplasmatota archaeon]
MDIGTTLAISGAGLAVGLSCVGSGIGVGIVGEIASGVLAEDPNKFGKLLVLQAIPGTQGIYGLLTGFIVMMKIGILGGTIQSIPLETGLAIMFACIPVMVGELFTAIAQGRVAATGVSLVAKREEEVGKAITLAAMVETYAVLSLLASLMMLNGIQL